jgi:RNA polymerase sigma-70 factor (ECF subfamily)
MHLALLPTVATPARKNSSGDLADRPSDEELIERIACADRDAMRQLFLRFRTPVYRFAFRLTGQEGTAEDITSDVFLDVWRTANAFEGRSRVSTWLLAITRNKAMARMRRRPTETLDDDVVETIEDESDGPDAILQKQQVRSILLEALKHLRPAHREIIDLVYYHDRSIDEVASILNIPSATVKTRMFYARHHLAQMVAQAGRDNIFAVELRATGSWSGSGA